MKIEEFKEIIDTIGFYSKLNLEVEEDEFDFIIKLNHRRCATVSKSTLYCIDTNFGVFEELNDNLRANLLDAINKLAETPLDERQEEKFYLKHRWMKNVAKKDGEKYYNLHIATNLPYLGSKVQDESNQTEFTKKEIEDIKKKYKTSLEDYELVEVEE